jgi:hypothetical protein
MIQYHEKTLQLLGITGEPNSNLTSKIRQKAEETSTIIPPAFLEWAELGGEEILSKYSNDDWFSFHNPRLITVEKGVSGLLFHKENQGNFSKIVQVENGDDPQVWTAWCGEQYWIVNADKFSNCVFAQVFDWQYLLEFDSTNTDSKKIAYYGTVELKSPENLEYLRENFVETVSTEMMIEDEIFKEYRFYRTLNERITVFQLPDSSGQIQITGETSKVKILESELKEAFG